MKKKIIITLSIFLFIISAGLFTYILINNINLKNNINTLTNDKMDLEKNISLSDSEILVLKEEKEKKEKEFEFEVKVYEEWKKTNENVLNYLK